MTDIYGEAIHVDWWKNHDNLITLCNWLAKNGRSGGEVAYAVEKPWKYEEEFNEAQADEARARRNTFDEKGQPYR